jgi:hypothetical protein
MDKVKKGVENVYLSSGTNKSISNFRETILLNVDEKMYTVLYNRESRFFDFLYITTEFGLIKEFKDRSKKGVFKFYVFLSGNEFFGPKKRKKSK